MVRALWVVALLGIAACADHDAEPTVAYLRDCSASSFHEISTNIISHSCNNFSSCHSVDGASSSGNLDLKTDPYQAMVGVDPVNLAAKNNGWKLVKPHSPLESFVVVKMTLPTLDDPTYGQLMPNSQRLTDETIKILCWIDRGAPND